MCHIYTMEYYAAIKNNEFVSFVGNSQQTDTRTENEIPHVLTHRWVMKNDNTWTQKGEY